MQRVRIGLTGLAIVFLLVLLTTALFGLITHDRAIRTDSAGRVVMAPSAAGNVSEQPKEPLAELGVTPGHSAEPAANSATPAAPTH